MYLCKYLLQICKKIVYHVRLDGLQIQQNSVKQTHKWLDRWWIFRYSRLSDSKYKFLHIMFCYCSYSWAVQLIRVFQLDVSFICWFRNIMVFQMDVSFICWFRNIMVLFCIFLFLHSWRSWWSRKQGVRRFQKVVVHTLLKTFLNMSLRSACFTDEACFWQKQNFWSWDYSPQHQIIRISELSDNGFKEFCCIFLYRGLFC